MPAAASLLPPFAQLPPRPDLAPLLQALSRIDEAEWTAHFNEGVHGRQWSGLALASPLGRDDDLRVGIGCAARFVPTPLAARCPELLAVAVDLGLPLRGVRLLKLVAGGRILEHRDTDLNPEAGEARLHLPLSAGAEVDFRLDGERVPMQPGEWWYVDVSRRHRVVNWSASDRINLVVDVELDARLRDWLLSGPPPQPGPDVPGSFEAFRTAALRDPALFAVLAAETGLPGFAAACVAAGQARGYRFSEADVLDAAKAGRQAWMEQWIH